MKKLTISESQTYLLNIAKEFDRICTRHNIPYYMLGGTLLGAVRHKGFIPWDDDMDFGIPIQYYEMALKTLVEELPYPYRVATFYNSPSCVTAFAKIEDETTYIDDPRTKRLKLDKYIGLNIDVFPLVYCDSKDPKIKKIRRLKKIYGLVFTDNAQGTIWKNNLKTIMRKVIRHQGKWYLKKQYDLLKEFNEDGAYLANVFGRWGKREIMPREVFSEGRRYIFEDITLRGPSNFDEYLRSIYGNYMTLPQAHQRLAHTDSAFVK